MLSWCFARALEELGAEISPERLAARLNFAGSYVELHEEIQQQMKRIKTSLPRMDQDAF